MDDSIEAILRQYILTEHLYLEERPSLDNDESLFARGVIDSIGLLQVVAFVEDRFDVKIAPDELIPENFGSVNLLKTFIWSKSGSNGGPL